MSDVSRAPWRRPGRAFLAAVLIGLSWPHPLSGQESKRNRVVAAFPVDAASSIDDIATSVTATGLSADPIYDKALEGVAKGVPVERILPALEAYATRLLDAHALLGHPPDLASVVAGADALARGVPAEAVRSVGRDAGDRGPLALVVLGDLAEAGVPADGALEAVRQALDASQAHDAVLHVPAAVRRLLREGHAPDRAVHDVTRLMRDGVPPQRIRDGRGGQG